MGRAIAAALSSPRKLSEGSSSMRLPRFSMRVHIRAGSAGSCAGEMITTSRAWPERATSAPRTGSSFEKISAMAARHWE